MQAAKFITLLGRAIPPWVLNRANAPDIAIDWANNQAWKKVGGLFTPTSLITISRASSKTNLFPTSASGFAYSTFLSNVASLTSLGLSIEEARTNVLLNSTAPVTQTTASLATGTYTLWVNGSGSATSSAGSATITGAGAATNGTPNVFVVTVAGTVTITVSGALNAFQCELGTFGTSLIVTAGVTATRAADVVTLTTPPTFGSAYSLYAKGTPQAPNAYSANQALIQVDAGNDTGRAAFYRDSSARFDVVGTTSGSAFWNTVLGTGYNQNSSLSGAAAFAASDQAGATRGAAPATNASGTPTVPVAVRFGAFSGGSYFNGFLEYSAIWASQRVTNAQLQSMTA